MRLKDTNLKLGKYQIKQMIIKTTDITQKAGRLKFVKEVCF